MIHDFMKHVFPWDLWTSYMILWLKTHQSHVFFSQKHTQATKGATFRSLNSQSQAAVQDGTMMFHRLRMKPSRLCFCNAWNEWLCISFFDETSSPIAIATNVQWVIANGLFDVETYGRLHQGCYFLIRCINVKQCKIGFVITKRPCNLMYSVYNAVKVIPSLY